VTGDSFDVTHEDLLKSEMGERVNEVEGFCIYIISMYMCFVTSSAALFYRERWVQAGF
jgi:hypothetical protein